MSEATVVTTDRMAWIDLGTKDVEAAKRFYSGLFDWTVEVEPNPEYGGYATFARDGEHVGGVMDLGDNPAPAAWVPYVGVDDVRAAFNRAVEAGAEEMIAPMDVGTAGSMAMLRDPAGAVIGLWQPGDHRGWDVFGEPRSVCWLELDSSDPERAGEFYREVFGWSPQPAEGMDYTLFKQEGSNDIGGLMKLPPGAPGSHWLTYFAIEDADATAARVKQLGGTVMVEPQDIPNVGRFSVASDPTGAVFGLLHPLPRG